MDLAGLGKGALLIPRSWVRVPPPSWTWLFPTVRLHYPVHYRATAGPRGWHQEGVLATLRSLSPPSWRKERGSGGPHAHSSPRLSQPGGSVAATGPSLGSQRSTHQSGVTQLVRLNHLTKKTYGPSVPMAGRDLPEGRPGTRPGLELPSSKTAPSWVGSSLGSSAGHSRGGKMGATS
jgi:hypothetical protein